MNTEEHPAVGRPATDIGVRQGRLLLFWPLALRLDKPASCADDVANAICRAAQRLRDEAAQRERAGKRATWTHIPDPLHHIAPPPDGIKRTRWENDAYAESVYFHEFVQSFLFRKQTKPDAAPFHLFRRADIRFAEITFAGTIRTLEIERLNLYMFRTGAAVLVVELATLPSNGTSDWTLAAFQDFHDHFRRVYAPFFDSYAPAERGPCPKAPTRVVWKGANEKGEIGEVVRQTAPGGGEATGEWDNSASVADVDRLVNHPDQKDGCRAPPVFGHWRFLLAGALPLAGETAPDDEGCWHQIVDDRMPTMATVSVTPVVTGEPVWKTLGYEHKEEAQRRAMAEFNSIREGDLIRLCFADDKGDAPYPYDQEFSLKEFWTKNVYTRFRSMGTLYLFSGYAFVAVGAGFDFDSHVMGHVRRHYFQMGLLAHFEMASLLSFSTQISQAVQHLDESGGDQAAFQAEMAAIEEQFLQFVHRFRFTGVSNQLQAREMFDTWRERLELDRLFADVQAEIHTANQFLTSRAQTSVSLSAASLSQVATIGVVLGLAFGMLGMNVVFTGDMLTQNALDMPRQTAIVLASVGAFMLLGGGFLQLIKPKASSSPRRESRSWLPDNVRSWLRALRQNELATQWHPLAILLFGLALICFVLAMRIGWPPPWLPPAAGPGAA